MGHTLVQTLIYALLSVPIGVLAGMALGTLAACVVNLFTDDLG